MSNSQVRFNKPNRYERRRIGPGAAWEQVVPVRPLWPKKELAELEAGELVVFDGYAWRQIWSMPEPL